MTPRMQRSGIPLLILAAVVLVAAVGMVVLLGSPIIDSLFGGREPDTVAARPPEPAPAPAAVEPAPQPEPPAPQPEPAAEAVPQESTPAESVAGPMEVARTHTVVKGDTLFDLARTYWGDPYLWPAILVANANTVIDPDYLRQGSVLDIPIKPDVTGSSGMKAIVDAHVEASRRYRRLGDEATATGRTRGDLWMMQLGLIRVNKAHWVLYSGLRYDPDLLDKAAGAVSERDLEIVRSFISRFGPRPGM